MKLSDMALECKVDNRRQIFNNAYEVVEQLVYSMVSYCCFAAKEIYIIPLHMIIES